LFVLLAIFHLFHVRSTLGIVLNANPNVFDSDKQSTANAESADSATSIADIFKIEMSSETSIQVENAIIENLVSDNIVEYGCNIANNGHNFENTCHQDSNGPAFYLKDHNLAIAFWCVPFVYKHALKTFIQSRHVVDEMLTKHYQLSIDLQSKLIDVHDSSRVLVLVNADNYSAWNARKYLLLCGFIKPDRELIFMNFVFSKHPKSGEAWAHRRWVISQHRTYADASVMRDFTPTSTIDAHTAAFSAAIATDAIAADAPIDKTICASNSIATATASKTSLCAALNNRVDLFSDWKYVDQELKVRYQGKDYFK
jgi:hypothetical protein